MRKTCKNDKTSQTAVFQNTFSHVWNELGISVGFQSGLELWRCCQMITSVPVGTESEQYKPMTFSWKQKIPHTYLCKYGLKSYDFEMILF